MHTVLSIMCFVKYGGYMCWTGPFRFQWLKGYIGISNHCHHIGISIFPFANMFWVALGLNRSPVELYKLYFLSLLGKLLFCFLSLHAFYDVWLEMQVVFNGQQIRILLGCTQLSQLCVLQNKGFYVLNRPMQISMIERIYLKFKSL